MNMRRPFSRWLIPNQYYNGELTSVGKQGYSLSVIEFDDQGELWDPCQLNNTLTHIQKVCRDSQGGNVSQGSGEVIVITFVHGWMHNAAPQDNNFKSFEALIQKRAEGEKEFAHEKHYKPRPIIGIYLAWRGLLWNIPIIKELTFWSRKTAAVRVGNLSCTEVIHRIIRVVKSRNDKSKCMFIGHSFGGLILEHALVQSLLGAIFERKTGPLDAPTEVDSPTDLIVLINPACEAIIAKQFIDILKRNNIKVTKEIKEGLPFPLLVSITSVGDVHTKRWFPFGQFFVNALKSFRKYDDAHSRSRSQRYLCSHTAGHTTYLHNFKVERSKGGDSDNEKLVFSTGQDKYEIVCQVEARNCVPFWLMQVPKEIVADHSEIFNDAFANMLAAFLQWGADAIDTTRIKCESPEQAVPSGVSKIP